MKKLFVILLMLVATVSFAQKVSFTTDYYDAGVGFTGYWSDIDSNVSYTSEYFDITSLDGQTIYLTYNYYTAGGTNDSLKLIIQGVFGDGTMTLNCDTINLVGASTTVATQLTPSLTGFAPRVRVLLSEPSTGAEAQRNRNNGVLRLNFYAKSLDAVYKWNKNWYN